MCDVPWAVAWYGDRPCVWLTLDARNRNFFAVNDYLKTVQALYLTPQTVDGKFVSDWVGAGESSWGNFIIDAEVNKKIPPQLSTSQRADPEVSARPFVPDRPRALVGGTH